MSQVFVEMTGDEKRLWASFQKILAQNTKLQEGLEKTKDSAKRAEVQFDKLGNAGGDAFGVGALTTLAKWTAGLSAAGWVLAQVKAALTDIRQLQDDAAAKAVGAEFDLAQLGQLAESPEEMLRLTSIARDLYGKGAARSLGEAGKLTFALQSANAMDQLDLFTQLASTGLVVDPVNMVYAANALRTAMGEEETGSVRALVSKAFGAGKGSPFSATDMLMAASMAGSNSAWLGLSDEEILAASDVLSRVNKSPEIGGTQLRSLVQSLSELGEEFRGRKLEDIVSDIESRNLDGEGLQKLLDRTEAIQAFRVLSQNKGAYQQSLEEVFAAEADDRVAKKLNLPGQDPSLYAARTKRTGEARRELSREEAGRYANVADAMGSDAEQQLRRSGKDELTIWAANKLFEWGRWFRGSDKGFVEGKALALANAMQRSAEALEAAARRLDARQPTLSQADRDK